MASSTLPGIKAPDIEQWPAPVAVWQHLGRSGQFQVRVDLIRGVGRPGAIPELNLLYQTGGPNSVFGLGWGLDIPAFSRGNGRHLPRYRDAGLEIDQFSSTDFGELVPVLHRVSGQWEEETARAGSLQIARLRPRTDTSFIRIERRTDAASGDVHWLTISRDNVTRVYGRTRDARIADPSDSRRVARWLLEEQWDSRGNHILFEYKREDLTGVPSSSLPERHRLRAAQIDAQLHPKRVRWGNGRAGEPGQWLFELVFDYGEHDGNAPEEGPEWRLRPDAFSDYRAGFEVRTRRLCRRALLFYHIPEISASPALIREHEFFYNSTPDTSLLTGLTVRYHRREQSGSTSSASLPAVSFTYTPKSDPGPVREVVFADGRTAAARAVSLQWHDLDGSSLPGLVSREPGGALYYRRNLGGGVLGSPEPLPSRPSLTDTTFPAAQNLDKPFGDGRSCLLDMSEGPGYQERVQKGNWSPYTPFPNTPSVRASASGTRNVDLDGDGRADLMLSGEFGVRWHRFHGRQGWTALQEVVATPVTQTALADRTGTVLLADMTGDGLADLVQVQPGSVRYWPNLGYGRFGEPVHMANSPLLEGPDLFDPTRVRLVDIDGSGPADLVYMGREAVVHFANRNGNSFGPPTAVTNLPAVTDLDSVDVVDFLGTGTGCLVWSSVSPGRVDRPMRYVELVGGRRPHLLTSINNNQGLEVEVSYRTSTELMVEDKGRGHAWHSTLPSPMWLATQVRENDLISGASQVMTWSYRHGYYDAADRETRGFGFVERRERQLIPPDPGGSAFGVPVPDRLTRTWYDTGAFSDRALFERRLEAEFFSGDPDHPARPGLSVQNDIGVPSRELLRALQGRPIREEVYGGVAGGTDAVPYTTVDYGYLLRALQPGADNASPAVATFTEQRVERTYERNAEDPRITHRLVLDLDMFGNATRQATLSYARRRPEQPEQGRSLWTVEEQDFINNASEREWYRVGVPSARRVFEVGPLARVESGRLVALEELRALWMSPDLVDIPFEQRLTTTGRPRRRLIGATKTRYWNDELSGPAPAGTAGQHALIYDQQQAAFTGGLLNDAFGDGTIGADLLQAAGYENADGFWWARGPRITYSVSDFFQPVSERTALTSEYSVVYDEHALFVAETRDPVGNVKGARYDYQALAAAIITDPNRTTVTTAFDALGLPIGVAMAGARGEGDSPGSPRVQIARDVLAWQRDRTPLSIRVSARARHADATSAWEQSISFIDGRGRNLQSKRLAEPASGERSSRWIVEMHNMLTGDGAAVRTYSSGFTANDGYSSEAAIAAFPVTRFRLDALERAHETLHPNGALTRTIQTSGIL